MKKTIIIITILVIVGVGGIAGALYTQIWNPAWNPFRPAPKIVLVKMALKMRGVKTFRVEGNVETENIKKTSYEYEEDKENINFNKKRDEFKFSLDVEKSNPKNQNNQLIIEGGSHSESQWGENKHSYDSSSKMESKKIGDILYFILTDTSEDKGIRRTKEVIYNQWIKLNREDIGDLVNLWLGEIDGEIDIKIPKEKQDELIKELIKLFIGRELYEIEELPDEEINGQMTYHYSLTLNEREIKRLVSDMILKIAEFISESVSISGSTSGYFREEYIMYLPMAVASINMGLQKEIGEFFEQMGGVDVEIWIGQRDSYLHKIQFKKEVDLVNYFEEKRSEWSKEEILEAERSVLIDINLSEFGKPIEIKPPEEFKDLEEIMEEFRRESEQRARDAKRQSDIRQISSAAEMYYNDTKEYPPFGKYEGVGMGINIKNGGLQVVASVEGSPAFKVGLRPGDKIRKINGISTIGMTVGEAVELIKGPSGTEVTLTIYKDEWGEERDIKIVRSVVKVPSIGIYLDPAPEDPGQGPCPSYQWISNMSNPQQYCIWACLESGEFFASSHKGTKKLDKAPTNLDCW